MTSSNKIIITTIFFLISTLGFSQISDTIIVSVDSASGVKKIIHLTFEGVNQNIDGAKFAKITKRNISKFDKTGKLIYKSDVISIMNGCVRDASKWEVISYDKSGSSKTLQLKKKGGFIIKSFDKNGKLISKEEEKYLYATWLDPDERSRFEP